MNKDVYVPGQGMTEYMSPFVSQSFKDIYKLKGMKGMEVFFKVPNLADDTVDRLEYISEHPGQTFFEAVIGGAGSGKREVVQGLIEVYRRSKMLKQANAKSKCDLEIWHISIAQSFNHAYAVGDISRDVPWGEWKQEHFQKASAHLRSGVGWAFWERPQDENGKTRIIIGELGGLIDPNPMNPSDKRASVKVDTGTSTLQVFSTSVNTRSIAIVTDPKVLKISLDYRKALGLLADPQAKTDPQILKNVLRAYRIDLLNHMSHQEYARTMADAGTTMFVFDAINKTMCRIGSRALNTDKFNLKDLKNDDQTRKEVESAYYRYVFDEWNLEERTIGENERITAGITIREDLIGKFKFPLKRVPVVVFEEKEEMGKKIRQMERLFSRLTLDHKYKVLNPYSQTPKSDEIEKKFSKE